MYTSWTYQCICTIVLCEYKQVDYEQNQKRNNSLIRKDLPVAFTRVAHCHFRAIHCILRWYKMLIIDISFSVTDGRNYNTG